MGVVHHAEPLPAAARSESSVTKLTRRIKAEFDPRRTAQSRCHPRPELPFVAAPPGTIESVTRFGPRRLRRTGGFAEPQLLRMGMNGIFTAGDGRAAAGQPTDRATASRRSPLAERWRQPDSACRRTSATMRSSPSDHAVFAIARDCRAAVQSIGAQSAR